MADVLSTTNKKEKVSSPSFPANKLVSPYIQTFLGPMTVIGADLKCVHRPDGTYHYTYTVTAEPAAEQPATASSSRSPHSTAPDYSIYSQRSAIFMRDVDFVLIYEGPTGKREHVEMTAEFETTATVYQMIKAFRQELYEYVTAKEFAPRLAIKIDNRTIAVGKELFGKTLKELLGGENPLNITIYADNRKS